MPCSRWSGCRCWRASALTAAYGFAILGSTRALDLGRERRVGEAAVYGAIGAIGVATVLAAVVFGIVILTNK